MSKKDKRIQFKWCHNLNKSFTKKYGGNYIINLGQFIKLSWLIKKSKVTVRQVTNWCNGVIEFKKKEKTSMEMSTSELINECREQRKKMMDYLGC